MPDVVISDASCLIILDKIERVDILKGLYQNVITTCGSQRIWQAIAFLG
jgi:predicted nucleic acid-binding protein